VLQFKVRQARRDLVLISSGQGLAGAQQVLYARVVIVCSSSRAVSRIIDHRLQTAFSRRCLPVNVCNTS